MPYLTIRRHVTQSMILAATLGLQLLGASEAQAEPKAQWSASVKAAVACAEKMQTTADTRSCWIAQIDKSRKILDQKYQQFLSVIPPDKRKGFVSAHKAWQQYHGAQCNLYMDLLEGTMWHPVSDQCILRKVEERTTELAEMRHNYGG